MNVDCSLVFEKDRNNLTSAVIQPHLVEKKLGYKKLNNVLCLPPRFNGRKYEGGICSQDGTFFSETGLHKGQGSYYKFDYHQAQRLDGAFIYLGWIHHTWGHAFTDGLKHLWFLRSDACKAYLNEGARLLYVSSINELPPRNIVAFFASLGIRLEDVLLITKPTTIQSLIVPEECIFGDNETKCYTDDYKKLIDGIKSKVVLSAPIMDKVYFSRTRVKDSLRRDHGEQVVERAFKKKGYKIIYPETLSFAEQLSILSQCSFFAATEGSVSHNAIFCRPGTEVAIIRKCDFVNQYQLVVNEVADLNVHYIDSHKSVNLLDDMKYRGPFFLYLSDNLRKYLGEVGWIWHWPYWLMPSWWYQRNFNRRIVRKIERQLKRFIVI